MDGGYNNYNSYGGGGGGGGGGFMPGEMNSPSGGKGGDRDNKTLRPVTVKQIVDASQPFPEANYQIDGADVASVLFIGQVRNISTQSTNVTYKIDDGTGEIEVKKWIDSGSADSMDTDEGKGPGSGKNEIQLNRYARISGAVKSFGNKRYVGAHNVLPVTDINELHCHILEATVVHLFFTRGPPGGANAGAKNASAAGGDAMMGGAEDYGAGQNRALMSMSPLAKRVYQVLRTEPQDDTGLHVQQIAAKMNVPATDVARAGEELLGAGVIFSTSDEQTWAILEY